MGKKDSFSVGDFVFAKVKGYPAWPAKVSCSYIFFLVPFVIRLVECVRTSQIAMMNVYYVPMEYINISICYISMDIDFINILTMDFALLLLLL